MTVENAEKARNTGFELELGQALGRHFFVSANYTYVDSEITLTQSGRQVQTSGQRPLAGQSKNLFNVMGEVLVGGFQTRILYNFFDDRISDVGAVGAPDIIANGRGALDLVFLQRIGQLSLRLTLDNLTDAGYRYTQGGLDERTYRLGRGVKIGLGYSFF